MQNNSKSDLNVESSNDFDPKFENAKINESCQNSQKTALATAKKSIDSNFQFTTTLNVKYTDEENEILNQNKPASQITETPEQVEEDGSEKEYMEMTIELQNRKYKKEIEKNKVKIHKLMRKQ